MRYLNSIFFYENLGDVRIYLVGFFMIFSDFFIFIFYFLKYFAPKATRGTRGGRGASSTKTQYFRTKLGMLIEYT